MPDRVTCYDCGGNGIDPGALHEPEACTVCLGAGELFVELDPCSSQYGHGEDQRLPARERKPVARAIFADCYRRCLSR